MMPTKGPGWSASMRIDVTSVVGAVVCLALGGWYYWETTQLDVDLAARVGGGVSAAGYPRVLAVVVLVLGAILLAVAVFRRRGGTGRPILGTGDAASAVAQGDEPPRVDRALGCLVALVILTLLFDPLGYPLAMPVLLFALMRIGGERRWLVPAASAVLLTAAVYVFFRYVLNIVLPLGVLGGLL